MRRRIMVALSGALVLLVLVVTLVAWSLHRARSPWYGVPQPLGLKAADIDELELASADKPAVLLKRIGAEWRVLQPVADRADQNLVAVTLAGLEDMQVGPQVTSWRHKHAELGIDDGQAIRVVPRQAGKPLAALVFSKRCDYLRLDGDSRVLEVHRLNRLDIDRKLALWRDREILSFSRPEIAAIEIDAGARHLVIKRDKDQPQARGPARETWIMANGTELVGGQLDAAVPASLADVLSRFEANTFADEATLASAGLDKPRAAATAVLANGKRFQLLVGNPAGEEVYVKRADGPRIWLAYAAPLEVLTQSPAEWRDRTLLHIDPEQVAKIELQRGGERQVFVRAPGNGWRAEPEVRNLDQARVQNLTLNLRNLAAVSIVDTAAARDTGLAAPSGAVRVTTRDGRTFVLTVGAEKGGQVFVQVTGRREVFLLSSFALGTIWRSPAELTLAAESR